MAHPFPLNQYLGTLADDLGCFPFDHETYLPQSDCCRWLYGIRSLIWFGMHFAPYPSQCSTSVSLTATLALKLFRGEPAISVFDWNFSPTHTSSEPFSQTPVRASTKFYLRFTLDMGRSHGFGSTACNYRPIQTRFPCGFAAEQLNLATHRNSLARSTKSTPSLALWLLVGIRFQVLFHSPPGVLFTFPSRYYSLSVIQ